MKRMLFVLILLFALLVKPQGTPLSAQQSTPMPASLTPNELTFGLCGNECLEQTIRVQLPALARPTLDVLDVLFLLDVSSSMDNVIDAAREGAAEISQELRRLVADTRFGVGIFSDYTDIPWQLMTDFTSETSVFQDALERIELQSGGDPPESYTRALWESGRLNWRASAVRLIILFTDAEPHFRDWGVDRAWGTADDLEFADVLQTLADNEIAVIGIDSSGGSSATADALRRAADDTDGRYTNLARVDDLSEAIVRGVEGELADLNIAFVPGNDEQRDWFSQTPANFRYPFEGTPVDVTLTMCPQTIGLTAGSYTLDLELRTRSTVYAVLPVTIDYAPHCVLLNVADTPTDDGLMCTDDSLFWESPDIVVRRAADDLYLSEYPIIGEQAFVYVRVTNLGVRDSLATVILYTSPSLLANGQSTDWSAVGRQQVSLPAQMDEWLGPFPWTPTTNTMSLRAVASSPQDEVNLTESYACEGNIAQLNRGVIELNNFSLRPGAASGSLFLSLPGVPIFELVARGADFASNEALAFTSTQGILQTAEGDGVLRLPISQTALGAGTLTISAVTSNQVYLEAQRGGRSIAGATLRLQPQTRPTSAVVAANETPPILPTAIPVTLTVVLVVVLLLWSIIRWISRKGQA